MIGEFAITKTRLFKYIENFTTKNWKSSGKNFDIFHNSAQNIDCGYSLGSPRRGGSNEYHNMFLSRNKKNNVYPYKAQFYYIKVGFKGVKIIQTCFHDISWYFTINSVRREGSEPIARIWVFARRPCLKVYRRILRISRSYMYRILVSHKFRCTVFY